MFVKIAGWRVMLNEETQKMKFITKRYRAYQAKTFIDDEKNKSLLDVGCGDGYFLSKLLFIDKIGIDKSLGDDAEEYIKRCDKNFDYITMLAVIEHFNNPFEILEGCRRILKENGLVIITTPKQSAEKFMKLYAKNIDHKRYFVKSDFESLEGYKMIHFSTFIFGLNQLIVLKKDEQNLQKR